MSGETRPFGYPIEEITLGTWFPKLDFQLESGFSGAEVGVGFSKESSLTPEARVVLYPDSLNVYASYSLEYDHTAAGLLVYYADIGASFETAYSLPAVGSRVLFTGYSSENDYTQEARVKIKDAAVRFTYQLNNAEPRTVRCLSASAYFSRALSGTAVQRAIDFSTDKRRHIDYTTTE